MNCEYVYTKNINRHLIHIVDKNNRRPGRVYGNNLMNITLYICMNLLNNLCDFFSKSIFLCRTLLCLCFLVITSVRRSLWRSQTNPSERKYLVYYLELCPTKHVTIYIKYFFHICFIKLSLVYTLCFKIKKYTQSGGGPLCPMRWIPLPKLLGKGGHFESKSIWFIIKSLRYQ